jgi:hypothetical protein
MKWVLVHGQTDDRLVDAIQRPSGRSWHSFNLIQSTHFSNSNNECENCSNSQFVLYGGYSNNEETLYDCWLLDPTKDDIPRHCNVHPDAVSKRWTRLRHIELGDTFGRRMWHCGVTLPYGIIIIGGYGTNYPIYLPDVDHPSKVIELEITPRTLYRSALDAVCKVFSSLELISNTSNLDVVKIDYKKEPCELPELLPALIWKDVQKRCPKYQYDNALKVIQENREKN